MTIDNPDVIDLTAIDHEKGEVFLVISDHLPWITDEIDQLYNEADHLYMLQSKIYRYLDFIQSGDIFDGVKNAKGKTPVIFINALHPLSRNGENLVNNLKQYLRGMGVEVRWKLYDPKPAPANLPPLN